MLQVIINKSEEQEVMIVSSKQGEETEKKTVYIKSSNEEQTKESKLYEDIQKLLSDFLS